MKTIISTGIDSIMGNLFRGSSLRLAAVGVLSVVWLILFIAGFLQYPGSGWFYFIFSIIFLVMLISGLYKQVTYGYLFLVIFLWLGFWFKLTAHQIFIYPFGEPVGLFDRSPAAWDNVLIIATSGCIGVILARVIYGYAGLASTISSAAVPVAPAWYPRAQKVMWILLGAMIAGCASLNIIYGIQQSGLVPRTLLIWPFNAVIYWMLSTGFAMGVATLLWWNLATKKMIGQASYMILNEAAMSTVSLLSRGLYVFHTIPGILCLYANRDLLPRVPVKRILIYIATFTGLMLISLSLVGTLRGYYYSNVPPVFIDFPDTSTSLNETGARLKFVVDRWVGIEGVMAISSYHNRGVDLFLDALTEKSEIGKSTRYQEVSLAHYRFMDMTKFQFASLPGAIAFFYYAGSLPFVMLGMLLLTLVALFSEKLISILTDNPFLSSFWGCAMANIIAQFGVAPRGLGPFFIMSLVAILTIWSVQSSYFCRMLSKIGLYKQTVT